MEHKGLNAPAKQKEIKMWVNNSSADVIGLLETRVKEENMEKIVASNWIIDHNYGSHRGGRIWVMWNPNSVALEVVNSTPQFILCRITRLTCNTILYCAMVYALNSPVERKDLWKGLSNAVEDFPDCPFVTLGDFNSIRFPSDKCGDNMERNSYSEDLNKLCCDANLDDLNYSGNFFTWNKSPGERRTCCKLDRVLVNDAWKLKFPLATVVFDNPVLSDHCPCVVSCGKRREPQENSFQVL